MSKPKIRVPLPGKAGGPMSGKKGDKGYNRKKEKEKLRREVNEDSQWFRK